MWSNVWYRWVPRFRIAAGVLAVALLGFQLFCLLQQPRLRGGALVLIAAVALLWLNRKHLRSHRRSFAFSWLRFPGYLLSLSLLLVLAGTLLSSLSLAAVGAVFYLGWRLGVRCTAHGWNKIAHGWALLLVLCFPSYPTFDPLQSATSWMVDFASQCLDLEGVFHLIDKSQLVLIDSEQAVSLHANSVFSPYGLFGLVCVLSAIRRWPAMLMSAALAGTLLFGATLPPLKIVIAGLSNVDGWPQDAIAFAACLVFTLSATSLIAFLLEPIARRRNSESRSRLVHIWSQSVNVTFAELMTRDESGFSSVSQSTANGKASANRLLADYFASRRWRLLFLSMPIGLGILSIVMSEAFRYSSVTHSSNFKSQYRQTLTNRILTKNFGTARLVVARLSQLMPQFSEPTIQLADAMVAAEDTESGIALVKQLLQREPRDSQGHLWMATQCLRNNSTTSESVLKAKQHLVAAINSDRLNWEAIYIYAILLASRGQRADAAEQLRKSTFANPAVELEIARLQYRLGLTSDAASRSQRLASDLTEHKTDSKTSADLLRIAEAYAIAGDLTNALTTLESATAVLDGDANVKESLIRTLLLMCRFDDPEHQSCRLDRVRRALEIDPQHPDLLVYCAKILFTLDPKSNGDLIALCREVVDQAVLSAESPAELFLVVGTAAAQKGKLEAAERFLRVAYEKGERSSAALNNLAWVIDQTKNGDTEFALKLVNEALLLDTNSRDALSTRGAILISLSRYKDAIVDLERLVQLQGASSQLASQLAILYDQVGDPETAEGYRTRVSPR